MHRTYSMRQSRAPTAAQIQNPPPPTSSTKSGRLFGKASLGKENPSNFSLSLHEQVFGTIAAAAAIGENYHHRLESSTDVLLSSRSCIPQKYRRRLRARPGQETLAAGEDGEERDAQHGARGQGTHGSGGMRDPVENY